LKVISIQQANLQECVNEAQKNGVLITRSGKPVAVLVGVEGMDLEQVTLGYSDDFWTLIRERRQQKTISRKELEKRLAHP
jgi:prevent-host-death family protein